MSSADQLQSTRIAGVCSRYGASGQIDDLATAVAELQEVVGDRLDLLAEHAGLCLGWAEAVAPITASRFRTEADLCIVAGADPEKIKQWIPVGRERAEAAMQTPTGVAEVRPSGLP
jgi:hypothetical protein